jgi:hypothetical protein
VVRRRRCWVNSPQVVNHGNCQIESSLCFVPNERDPDWHGNPSEPHTIATLLRRLPVTGSALEPPFKADTRRFRLYSDPGSYGSCYYGTNVPLTSTVTMYLLSDSGPDQTIPITLTGANLASTATVSVIFPSIGARGFLSRQQPTFALHGNAGDLGTGSFEASCNAMIG